MTTIVGSSGDDTLTAAAGDAVSGGEGNDVFLATSGGNTFFGGPGQDTIDYGQVTPIDGVGVLVLLDWGETYRGALHELPDNWFWDEWDRWLFKWDRFASVENASGSPFDDILFGRGGGLLLGRAGDDTLGSGGDDTLRGGEGDDLLVGLASFDDLHGNQGHDTVDGGGGADWVVGGQGHDLLFGGDGADVVLGNLGDDTCDGGPGNDAVRGGQGDDVIHGGGGDDWLAGDRGQDTLAGGAGADVFWAGPESGLDRVLDFDAAEGDRVSLLAGASYILAQVGADTVVSIGGAQLVLTGVELARLPPGWIFEG